MNIVRELICTMAQCGRINKFLLGEAEASDVLWGNFSGKPGERFEQGALYRVTFEKIGPVSGNGPVGE